MHITALSAFFCFVFLQERYLFHFLFFCTVKIVSAMRFSLLRYLFRILYVSLPSFVLFCSPALQSTLFFFLFLLVFCISTYFFPSNSTSPIHSMTWAKEKVCAKRSALPEKRKRKRQNRNTVFCTQIFLPTLLFLPFSHSKSTSLKY